MLGFDREKITDLHKHYSALCVTHSKEIEQAKANNNIRLVSVLQTQLRLSIGIRDYYWQVLQGDREHVDKPDAPKRFSSIGLLYRIPA